MHSTKLQAAPQMVDFVPVFVPHLASALRYSRLTCFWDLGHLHLLSVLLWPDSNPEETERLLSPNQSFDCQRRPPACPN